MEQHDIFETKLREAARKAETQDFPAIEKVWNRVNDKLDGKQQKTAHIFWKRIAIAASILLCIGIGYEVLYDRTPATQPRQYVAPGTEIVTDAARKETVTPAPDGSRSQTIPPATTVTKTVSPDAQSRGVAMTHPEEEAVSTFPITDYSSNGNEAVAAVDDAEKVKETEDDKISNNASFSNLASAAAEPAAKANRFRITNDTMVALTKEKDTETGRLKTSVYYTYTGIVTDSVTGEPLPAARVAVEKTSRGVETDFDGKFSIKAEKGERLVCEFVGMKPKTVTLGNPSEKLVIALSQEQLLQETYGYSEPTPRKSNIIFIPKTVAVTEIEKAQVAVSENTRLVTTLQSKTRPDSAGPNVSAIWRKALEDRNNDRPLYVLDGFSITPGELNRLTADHIETVTVLETAAATKLYASRGKNGAIVIKSTRRVEGRDSRSILKAWLRELPKETGDKKE